MVDYPATKNMVIPDETIPDSAILQRGVMAALQSVYDPEIPVNIYELGLIYKCQVESSGDVFVEMTLTAPGCPVAGTMPGMVEQAIRQVPGIHKVEVKLVWDPPWDKSMMSDVARLELGWM